MQPTLPSGRPGRAEVTASLAGRSAIVAGVGTGLGTESALALARHGADVALAARGTEYLSELADRIEALGRRAICVPTDVADPNACRALAAATVDAFGRIDVLVNNAVATPTATLRACELFEDADLEEWRFHMEVDYWGSLNMTRAVVPAMKAAGSGSIVMVNTMYTKVIHPNLGWYAGAKGALETVTKALATELGPHGIRVNGIHPGYIYTEQAREQRLQESATARGITSDEAYDEFARRIPLRYMIPASEIAGSVLFLASDLSSAITGQSLHANGGEYCH